MAVLSTLAVACSAGSTDHGGGGPSTTSSAPTSGSTTTEATTTTAALPGGVDPDAFDVPDGVWEGLGDPRIDVLHQDVTLRHDPASEAIDGHVDITLRPRTDEPLGSFTLDLRGPEIEEAKVDGAAAEVVADAHAAQVEIVPAEPLEPGEDVVVSIAYGGEPAPDDFPLGFSGIGWLDDASGGNFTLSQPDGTSTWVPVNDHPSDKATWTVTLDTPEDLTGVANGTLESVEEAEGRRIARWEMTEPIPSYVVLVAIGEYRMTEREGPDGIPIVLAVSEAHPESVDALFDEADDILEYFADTFGPYPFASSTLR